MLLIEIKAIIAEHKLGEFTRTRESLLAKLEGINGLKSIVSDQLENEFHIKLLFEDGLLIDDVKQSSWYTYLLGAIKVLGEGNKIIISTVN